MATVSEALSIALDHHIAGRVAEAETLYGRILEAVPGHPDASHLMGLLLAQTGRVAAALPHLDAAVAGDPASPTYHLNRGKVQDALGQTVAAAASWLATLRRQPDHGEAAERLAPALRVLAETAFDSGALASAAALYERVLALDPQNLSATFDAAMAAKGLGRLQEAAWLAGLSARLDPALLRARMAEAEARQVLGQTERAIAALRPALALDPAQGGCWASLCLLHNELGRGGAAVTAGRRAALAAPAPPPTPGFWSGSPPPSRSPRSRARRWRRRGAACRSTPPRRSCTSLWARRSTRCTPWRRPGGRWTAPAGCVPAMRRCWPNMAGCASALD
ncbi:tetratricopeptide repeat protein [Azospirillum brasilense]|uniref:tetratricopeptide repeat protein n=1 Tax=Azospirillum brasilense TaxID=192 RepID=UPI0016591738|nr:tetratricopeptide repeat protein [Azospirillum brasilense]